MLQAGSPRFRFPMRSLDFQLTLSFQPHYGPGVDSASMRRTVLEDIWGGARRGLLRSSSLSQEGGVVQLALRGS
jgi:hypothetical protein